MGNRGGHPFSLINKLIIGKQQSGQKSLQYHLMSEQNPHVVRVHRILKKLEQVRAANLSCFGSEKHQFQLNPPTTEAELQTFESQHQVQLPADYRAFLQYAGNGGAGPYYGIYPLKMWNDLVDWTVDDVPDNVLSLPCPLYPDLPPTAGWDEGLGEVSPYQGTLSLGTQGCSYVMQLIITGPFAGRVVYGDADLHPPYLVREPDFLSWYERWLDELLQGYNIHWFGHGPGGGEVDFFRILDDPQASDKLKSEAAWAFARLPRLSDAAARLIPGYLAHRVAGVRSGALAAIQTFELQETAGGASQWLNDHDAGVRAQAVRALMKLDPQRWAGPVLHLLHEESEESVASTAFFRLKEAGVLSRAELLNIIQRTSLGNLRSLATYYMEWAAEDVPLLIDLLADPNQEVRRYALMGLRRVKEPTADSLPAVLELLSRETDALLIGSILKFLGELAEPSTVPTLLHWATAADDFHRLDAIESLAKIGDERAVPLAQAMLAEDRPPIRRDESGLTSQSSVYTIRTLVQETLKKSPNPVLRRLAG
jgi:HEAT repeat protein